MNNLFMILILLFISCKQEEEVNTSFSYIKDCRSEQCFAVVKLKGGNDYGTVYNYGIVWVPCKKVQSLIEKDCK